MFQNHNKGYYRSSFVFYAPYVSAHSTQEHTEQVRHCGRDLLINPDSTKVVSRATVRHRSIHISVAPDWTQDIIPTPML